MGIRHSYMNRMNSIVEKFEKAGDYKSDAHQQVRNELQIFFEMHGYPPNCKLSDPNHTGRTKSIGEGGEHYFCDPQSVCHHLHI